MKYLFIPNPTNPNQVVADIYISGESSTVINGKAYEVWKFLKTDHSNWDDLILDIKGKVTELNNSI